MIDFFICKRGTVFMRKYFIAIFLLLAFEMSFSQSIVNEKEYYDSLKPHQFKGTAGLGLNINTDGTTNTFLLADASISYADKKSLFEFNNSLYYNSNGGDRESNRYRAYIRAALYRHLFDGNKIIKEHSFFPEINVISTYDESRGLNYRFSGTAGITYSLHDQKHYRMKLGTGLMYEKESWRVLSHEFLPTLDTMPQAVLDFIKDKFGIDSRGNIVKDNVRWSSYLQLVVNFGKGIDVTAMGIIQVPLKPPYENNYNITDLPQNNKKYPRLTLDITASFKISTHLAFETKYFVQKDEGQISPFAKKVIGNFSQGLSYSF